MESFTVPDLMCDACAARVRRALDGVAGVAAVTIDVPTKRVEVTGPAPRAALVKALVKAGYSPR